MCLNCHVVSIGVQIKHLQVLAKACDRVGLQFHTGHQGYRWYGSWVGDSPLPRELFHDNKDFEAMKAMSDDARSLAMTAIINRPDAYIRIPNSNAYDIGIYRVGEQYALFLDEWHGSLSTEQRDKLIQSYAIETSIAEAQLQGHTVAEHCFEDGTVELHIATGE